MTLADGFCSAWSVIDAIVLLVWRFAAPPSQMLADGPAVKKSSDVESTHTEGNVLHRKGPVEVPERPDAPVELSEQKGGPLEVPERKDAPAELPAYPSVIRNAQGEKGMA